jgi:hypothetical protein
LSIGLPLNFYHWFLWSLIKSLWLFTNLDRDISLLRLVKAVDNIILPISSLLRGVRSLLWRITLILVLGWIALRSLNHLLLRRHWDNYLLAWLFSDQLILLLNWLSLMPGLDNLLGSLVRRSRLLLHILIGGHLPRLISWFLCLRVYELIRSSTLVGIRIRLRAILVYTLGWVLHDHWSGSSLASLRNVAVNYLTGLVLRHLGNHKLLLSSIRTGCNNDLVLVHACLRVHHCLLRRLLHKADVWNVIDLGLPSNDLQLSLFLAEPHRLLFLIIKAFCSYLEVPLLVLSIKDHGIFFSTQGLSTASLNLLDRCAHLAFNLLRLVRALLACLYFIFFNVFNSKLQIYKPHKSLHFHILALDFACSTWKINITSAWLEDLLLLFFFWVPCSIRLNKIKDYGLRGKA